MATHRLGTAEDLAKLPTLLISFGKRPSEPRPDEADEPKDDEETKP